MTKGAGLGGGHGSLITVLLNTFAARCKLNCHLESLRIQGNSLASLGLIRSSCDVGQRVRGSPSAFDACVLLPQNLARNLSPTHAILGLAGRTVSAFELLQCVLFVRN